MANGVVLSSIAKLCEMFYSTLYSFYAEGAKEGSFVRMNSCKDLMSRGPVYLCTGFPLLKIMKVGNPFTEYLSASLGKAEQLT